MPDGRTKDKMDEREKEGGFPESPSPWRPLLVLLLVSALPYLLSLSCDFVYDDHGQIVENPFLRNPANIGDVLALRTIGDPHIINGRRPLTLLTYFTDQALWGLRPAGFRLTNLLLHLAAIALLYHLLVRLRRLTSAPPGWPFGAALLFGLHPLLFEAVHVPSFRPDILYSLAVLAALASARGLPETYRAAWLWRIAAAAGALAAALLAKEAGVVALAMVWMFWVLFPAARPPRRTMIGLSVAGLLWVGLYVWLGRGGAPLQAAADVWNGRSLRFPDHLLTAPWLWVQYWRLLVVPFPLRVDWVIEPVSSLFSLRLAAGVAALGLTGAALWRWRFQHPRRCFALGWMLAGFLPVSNLAPLLNPLAERYAYFMTAGFALLAADFLSGLPPRMARRGLMTAAGLCLLLALIQLPRWRNDERLWAHALRWEPRSSRALVWTGLALKRQGQRGAAETRFRRAIEANPQDPTGWINLAVLQGEAGDLRGAEELLREAIRRRPDSVEAHWNLFFDLQLQGRPADARPVLEQTLRLNPWFLPAREALLEIWMDEGRHQEVRPFLEETLRMDPRNPAALQFRDALRARSASP
jgi:tetratricopeptide (TPR) repeat protein